MGSEQSTPLNPPYCFDIDRRGFEAGLRGGIFVHQDILLLYDFARRQQHRIDLQTTKIERLRKAMEQEKKRRVYYQGIVYHVCNALDQIGRRDKQFRIRCGTAQDPSREVQEAMDCLVRLTPSAVQFTAGEVPDA